MCTPSLVIHTPKSAEAPRQFLRALVPPNSKRSHHFKVGLVLLRTTRRVTCNTRGQFMKPRRKIKDAGLITVSGHILQQERGSATKSRTKVTKNKFTVYDQFPSSPAPQRASFSHNH